MTTGKYILDRRPELLIKELAESLKAVDTNCQGRAAAVTRIILGTPSLGILKSHPTSQNMVIVIAGRMIAHKIPIYVCLYRTTISRYASI